MNKVKKLLSIDDLYNFYSTKKKSMTFSADKSGYNIAVQVNGKFEVQNDDNSEGLLYGRIKAFHDLGNRNKSYIDSEVFEKYVPSMKDRPIMADIIDIEDEDGNIVKDFNGHTMMYDEKKDKFIYIETPVGHFVNPENFELIYDEDLGRTFVHGDVVVYEEYTDACDILRRRQEVDVSVELCIRDLSYDCKTSELHINNFYVQGCTLLGSHVQPGMAGSKLSLKDFSEQNNSVFSNLSDIDNLKEKIIEMQESIDSLLSRFNIDDSKESEETCGKEEVEVENQEILVNEEVATTEEFIEEIVEVTEEESTEEVTETEEVEDPVEDDTPEVVETEAEEIVETEEVEDSEEVEEEIIEEAEEAEEALYELIERSFEIDGRKFNVSFELSHDDIRYGLYNLLSVYDELDNEWYGIRAVYNDYFVMQGWCAGKIYGQKYTQDGDTVAFDGERWNLHEELLSDSELAALNEMRANYSLLEQFKLDTEAAQLHAQRESIIFNGKYSVLADKDEEGRYKNEAYAKLVSEMDNYSLTDLEKELKSVFADYITNGGQFAYTGESDVKSMASKKIFATPTSKNKPSRYGNLFNK